MWLSSTSVTRFRASSRNICRVYNVGHVSASRAVVILFVYVVKADRLTDCVRFAVVAASAMIL